MDAKQEKRAIGGDHYYVESTNKHYLAKERLLITWKHPVKFLSYRK